MRSSSCLIFDEWRAIDLLKLWELWFCPIDHPSKAFNLYVNQISSSFMKMSHSVINFPPESSHTD